MAITITSTDPNLLTQIAEVAAEWRHTVKSLPELYGQKPEHREATKRAGALEFELDRLLALATTEGEA